MSMNFRCLLYSRMVNRMSDKPITIQDVKLRFHQINIEISDEQAKEYLQVCEDVASLAKKYSLEETVTVLREATLGILSNER